jgi:hypothetical protein
MVPPPPLPHPSFGGRMGPYPLILSEYENLLNNLLGLKDGEEDG